MTKPVVYLDYAAATPMDDRVIAAMQPYFNDKFYNPSGISLLSKAAKQDLETARQLVANSLGARPSEIIFTAGGTEANNLALFGVTAGNQPGHVITTALEHESVLTPARYLSEKGWRLTEVRPNEKGVVSAAQIAAAITDETILVSVMYANNEVGTVQPIKEIAAEIQRVRKQRLAEGNERPIYLHTDAAQATNYLDIHVHRLGVDLMTINGGKIYGPKQSGVLYVASHVNLTPIIFGGGQERGYRSGTENVAAVIGLAQAIKIATEMRYDETLRLKEIQQYCVNQLQAEIPNVVINGSLKHRLPNNVHFTVPGADNERLLYALEDQGIVCAAGSACSASKEEASHVLLAMGLPESDVRASLRLSFGRQTTKEDIVSLVTALKNVA